MCHNPFCERIKSVLGDRRSCLLKMIDWHQGGGDDRPDHVEFRRIEDSPDQECITGHGECPCEALADVEKQLARQ